MAEHSGADKLRRDELLKAYRECPIPSSEVLLNPRLYIERPVLSRILYMDALYRKIKDTPGVVMEFGVRWGQNMVLLSNLQAIRAV